ncbi:MAG: hypothetical protein E6767_06475 [Dysgonomonas sp.]|nr:hypothetical protein [Dysgonomonas sp.]
MKKRFHILFILSVICLISCGGSTNKSDKIDAAESGRESGSTNSTMVCYGEYHHANHCGEGSWNNALDAAQNIEWAIKQGYYFYDSTEDILKKLKAADAWAKQALNFDPRCEKLLKTKEKLVKLGETIKPVSEELIEIVESAKAENDELEKREEMFQLLSTKTEKIKSYENLYNEFTKELKASNAG